MNDGIFITVKALIVVL